MIKISQITAVIINFFILYLILRHFLFRPVTNMMNSRKARIEGNLAKAKDDMKEAEALKNENETLLRQAAEEGKKITKERKAKAEDLYAEIVAEAHKEAEIIYDRAKVEIEREKEKAQNEVKSAVIELAVMLSAKALEENIDEKKHRQLIEDYLSKVGN
ncbi:F0F1 ATP synthase subunit B [Clostridium amazonitimonense]|uniref:F0F1 ATP synthase subunit B n=1 Tax=Clostridium amazonitimonense TaxID=1499689 RepID=UPI0005094F43|nr:F0F1 ATP synthase subunit B [Clostridium amazonitimonense]